MSRTQQFRRASIAPAFTLIELLVVISIIALLISILLPALASARQSAQAVSCESNLHQIMIAQSAYLNDEGWFTPPSLPVNSTTMPFNQHYWWYRLKPYISLPYVVQPGDPDGWNRSYALVQTGVFLCPSMEIKGINQRSYSINDFGTGMGYDPINKTSFWGLEPVKAMNPNGSNVYELTVRDDSIAMRRRPMRQADLMFISELGTTPGSDYTHFSIRSGYTWDGTAPSTEPDFRHKQTKNVLFLDGHATPAMFGDITYQTDRLK